MTQRPALAMKPLRFLVETRVEMPGYAQTVLPGEAALVPVPLVEQYLRERRAVPFKSTSMLRT